MRSIAAALVMAGTFAPTARAGDEPAAARTRVIEERAAAPRGWLDLGAHGRPGAVTAQMLLDAPRFESSIDVEGRAPQDLNETMAVWWRHFDLPAPAIYGQGSNYLPGSRAAPAVNVLPVFDWLVDKIKDRKNRN